MKPSELEATHSLYLLLTFVKQRTGKVVRTRIFIFSEVGAIIYDRSVKSKKPIKDELVSNSLNTVIILTS